MRQLVLLLFSLLLLAEEYDEFAFEGDEFEKKVLDYQGYIRSENTFLHSDREHKKIAKTNNEFNLKADLDYKLINLHADYSFFYRHTEYDSAQTESILNALYQRFGDERQSLSVGKEVLRWGKGYAYSPVAFFERPKDPIYPELSREGYWMAHGKFTRTLDGGFIDNYTVTLLGLPDVDDNDPLFEHTDSKYGVKLYLLLDQTDIDLIIGDDAYGIDFSTNAAEGLELHGEYAYKASEESYLAGLRFQSSGDLTVIAEYMKTFNQDKLLYLKMTQKEPFSLLYSSLYGVYIDDVDTGTYRLQAGGTYDFKNGIAADLALIESDQGHGVKFILYYYF